MQGNLLRRAGLASTYARGAVAGNDSTSPVPFMEASAINQRNLLPRLAVGGAIFLWRPRKRPPPPPFSLAVLLLLLLLLQSTPSATLPRRPSQRTSLLSPSLLSYARSYARASRREGREERDSPRARIQRLLRGAIARKTRVFHTFLLVFGSRISPEQRRAKSNERARGREGERATDGTAVAAVRCRATIPSRILHNTYFMRDVAREEARNKRLRDDVASFLDAMVRVFENKARVSPRRLCSMEIRRGRGGKRLRRIGISRRGAAISPMNF